MAFEDLGDAAIAAGNSLYNKAKKIGQEAANTSRAITQKIKPAFGKGLIDLYAEAKDNIPKFGPPLEYGYIPQAPKSEIRITPQSNLTLEDIAKARAEQLTNEAKLQNIYDVLRESALLQGVNNMQRQTVAQPYALQQLSGQMSIMTSTPKQVLGQAPVMPANNPATINPITPQEMAQTLAPQQQLSQLQMLPLTQQLMQQQMHPQTQAYIPATQMPTPNGPQIVFLLDDKTGAVSTILNEFPNAQEAEAEVNKLRNQGLPAYYATKGYINNLRLKA